MNGIRNIRVWVLTGLFFLPWLTAAGQQEVTDLLEQVLGTDQQLVNGIQFSNPYARVDGQPYFLNGNFQQGRLKIRDRWVEPVQLRYNLYAQRVEIEYTTRQGHRNQIMTVPELVPAFSLHGIEFSRAQLPGRQPVYYQVVRWGSDIAYAGWSCSMFSSQNNSSNPSEFSPPERIYWIRIEGEWVSFDNRRSFLRLFPGERKNVFARILRDQQFSFQNATALEIESLLKAVLTSMGGDP